MTWKRVRITQTVPDQSASACKAVHGKPRHAHDNTNTPCRSLALRKHVPGTDLADPISQRSGIWNKWCRPVKMICVICAVIWHIRYVHHCTMMLVVFAQQYIGSLQQQ